ncbi:MAG: DUF6134 family protein [Cyclobacteriaceae bacterium]
MGKLSTIIIFLFLAASSANGQMLKYDVVRGTKKLGDMTVERRSYNNEIEYHIKSKVVFRILFSFTVDFECTAFYKNNILERESTVSKLNGSSQKASELVRNGDNYSHTLNDLTTTEEGPIDYSIAAIYFKEPYPNQKVYSAQFGQYLTFEKIGNNVYKMESPDGINIYTYMNGICTEVKVSRDFAKFYFKMAPETFYALKNGLDSAVTGN